MTILLVDLEDLETSSLGPISRDGIPQFMTAPRNWSIMVVVLWMASSKCCSKVGVLQLWTASSKC